MKQLFIYHNSIQYEFRLLEQSNIVQIIKADVLTYLMKLNHRSFFVCNCPGSIYHGRCWHYSYISNLLSMPSINEFWAQIAEEAEVMKGGDFSG